MLNSFNLNKNHSQTNYLLKRHYVDGRLIKSPSYLYSFNLTRNEMNYEITQLNKKYKNESFNHF